ncbi:hypothetical protein EKG95_26800 [Salmonella enterica subsp. enterica serovar Aqua]|uniref:Uncharacterized protein n=1 Tax=Salmonella enterica subsp. enterica serovar Aqua TaxID=1302615 RepID=A0A5X6ESW5_SALET|nr:hypothetical protein [Salmonella enterica subsp. enterica serovar Bareilly]ECA3795339.1 hypothetical protein [Salmonella enterica subsp. enterica serovar Aqua]ECC9721690.1 hypothetical protein [Salmonella enterica subsp. diarizonae]
MIRRRENKQNGEKARKKGSSAIFILQALKNRVLFNDFRNGILVRSIRKTDLNSWCATPQGGRKLAQNG